jgi:hypothetical protein
VAIVPGGGAATGPGPVPGTASHPLNLALNLGYLGAQFHALAATGAGIATSLTTGAGRQGTVSGGRRADFADPMLGRYAAQIAADKLTQVTELRAALGSATAAQPGIDFSAGATSAFSLAAQGARLVPAGSGWDAFANDANYLLGAFMIENVVAAAYRTLLDQVGDPAGKMLVADHLGTAIFHGGLIRSMLAAKAADTPSLEANVRDLSVLMATLDGTGGSDADIVDLEGVAIPYSRDMAQVMRAVSLSTSGAGGFLPTGANGVSA